MMPAGPDTIERSVCVCVRWREWDVKHHIKALFVMPEASQLWGFVVMVWLDQGWCKLTLYASQLLLLLLILLGSTVDVWRMRCFCVVAY